MSEFKDFVLKKVEKCKGSEEFLNALMSEKHVVFNGEKNHSIYVRNLRKRRVTPKEIINVHDAADEKGNTDDNTMRIEIIDKESGATEYFEVVKNGTFPNYQT